jgi:alpha-beta hydrolase superfamily lysophospholipase
MAMGKKVWRVLGIPVFLLFVFLVAMALLSNFQARLIYYPNYPTREVRENPGEYGLSYEEVVFETSDGIRLSGWFIPADNVRGTVLFCHGNAGNISHRMETIRVLNRLELSIFIFDYRGYGRSEGKVAEQGTYRDVEAAWSYLVEERGIPASEVILFGRSLGGSIAAWAAQNRDAKGLIVESAFTSIPDIGSHLYPFLPVRLLARFRYATIDYVVNVHCPVLVVHSIDDEMIPFEHGQRIFDAAREPKRMLELRGSHNETVFESGRQYENGLNEFITNLSQ